MKKLIFILSLFISISSLLAQNSILKGKVFDDSDGEPLIGATVKINYNNIQKFHDIRLKKWYKNYFLHLWIKNCLKKGYSFDAYSKV